MTRLVARFRSLLKETFGAITRALLSNPAEACVRVRG